MTTSSTVIYNIAKTVATELFKDATAPLINAKLQVNNTLFNALEKGVSYRSCWVT